MNLNLVNKYYKIDNKEVRELYEEALKSVLKHLMPLIVLQIIVTVLDKKLFSI